MTFMGLSVIVAIVLCEHLQPFRCDRELTVPQVCGRDRTSAVMLATKRPTGVTLEVNLREHVTHTPLPSANKAAHSGFEIQRRCHQKSKTGASVAPQKGLMS